jgi:hypothetical protein
VKAGCSCLIKGGGGWVTVGGVPIEKGRLTDGAGGAGTWTGTSRYTTFGSGGYIIRTTANVMSCNRAITAMVAIAT